jgi:hypothetical protein
VPGVTFEKALEENPMPRRVGDVRLAYESPLLLAEADRSSAGLAGPLLLASGLGCALAAGTVVLLSEPAPLTLGLALAAIAGGLVWAGASLEGRARRRRRFTLDFDAHTLRLDLTKRPRGLPRSLVVPFDQVEALTVLEQPGGAWTLTVDVAPEGHPTRLREVLVANVRPADAQALGCLHRLLDGAFDL